MDYAIVEGAVRGRRVPNDWAKLSELVHFSQSMLQATSACLFWADGESDSELALKTGLCDAMEREYFEWGHRHDPLHPDRLAAKPEAIVFLSDRGREAHSSPEIYRAFLTSYGIVDEVDFVLRQDKRPVAVMSVMKRACDPPFDRQSFQWETLHRHLEFVLREHPRVQEIRTRVRLLNDFRLTPREVEVAGLVGKGASNAAIAQAMGIGVATVKTHIVNILDKLGVDSRFAINAFVASI